MQHERAPRPLPLFLELLRKVSENDRELARDALLGLRAYEAAPRDEPPAPKPEIARARGTSLRDHGGDGPPVLLIPSLINPPNILDLDAQVSLADAIARMGRKALLLDWGPAAGRSGLDVAGHVEHLLLPLLRSISEPAALVGYCLGGTMAIAAANLAPSERVVDFGEPVELRALSGPFARRAAGHVASFPGREPRSWGRCRWRCCRPPSGRSIPSGR